ncbi:MAG: SPFH domain-containing protein [Legionellaceae bacterium]|nr:SPFH domain-containing protein [Legionellaceae bacterium]
MKFNLDKFKKDYNQAQKEAGREVNKWLFSVMTFGLGALYLWLTTIIIKDGSIGLRSNARGEMTLLPPGRHSIFPWENYPCRPQSLSQDIIELDRYKIITVSTGQVAQTRNQGVLEILQEGQHLIDDPSHIFQEFVSIKQETNKLHEVIASTSDNVGLTLKPDVRYQIIDPQKALGCIHDIQASIIERAEMTISKIVGSHTLADFAPKATNVILEGGSTTGSTTGDAKAGLSAILDEITDSLKANLKDIGIELLSLGVTSWTINDTDLAHQLAQRAVIQSQTESEQLAAEQKASTLKISSEAEAVATKTRADAEAQAIRAIGAAHKEVADSFGESSMALTVYQASQAVEMVKHANNPYLFLNSGGQQVVPTMPLSTQHLSSTV